MTVPDGAAARLRRLLAVLAWLSQVGTAPIDEVAARFDVEPSTLVAELELAACCGIPPYTPDQLLEIVVTDSSVSVRPGDQLSRPRRLAPDEGFALAAAARAVLEVPGSDPDGNLARALGKLEGALGPASLDVELDAPPALAAVRAAATAGSSLDVEYYSAGTDRVATRRIEPWWTFATEGHWYVDAYCHLAGGPRRFRVDRIASTAAAGPATEPVPAGPGAPAPGTPPPGASAFVPGPDSRMVGLTVAAGALGVFEGIPLPVEPVVEGELASVTVAVGGDAWLAGVLLELGPDLVAVDPPEAAAAAEAVVRRMADRYGPG